MAANTEPTATNITANPAFIAALNNNVIDINEPNQFDNNQPGFVTQIFNFCGSFCTLKGFARSFSFYYLTLNLLLFVLSLIYHSSSTSSSIWYVGFLIVIIVNIVLCIWALFMFYYTDQPIVEGDMAGMNAISTPEDDKSSSFKTVLTINSKAVQPSVVAFKSPAVEVDQTVTTATKQATAEDTFTTPAPAGGSKSPDEPKKKDKGKHKGGKHDHHNREKGRSKEKAVAAKETNFAAIPSNVLAKEAKREDNAKKKKKKKVKHDKKKR